MDRQTYLLMNRWIDEEIDKHGDRNKWGKVQTDRIIHALVDIKTEVQTD
jgi:ribonucleotide reductase beta subunit family protein with ferritin-like domain